MPVLFYGVMCAYLSALPFSLSMSFYPLLLQYLGFGEESSGMLLALRAVGGIASGLLVARFVHTGPGSPWPVIAGAFVAVGVGLQPLVSHWAAVGAFMLALGLGSGLMTIYFQVTMAEIVQPEMRGSAMALGGMGWGVSHLSTPLVMGFLADRYGIAAGFYVLGALSLAVVVLVAALRKLGLRAHQARNRPRHGRGRMKLSILDQSPIISGHSAARALDETLKLARRADELGFHRYWLAEHHAIAALADACPEILLARLGAETKRIRVGTGGVLLPYYSAFKVAEIFRNAGGPLPGPHRPRHRPRAGRRPAHRARRGRRPLSGRRTISSAGLGADRLPRRHPAGRSSQRQGARPAGNEKQRRNCGCSAPRTTAACWRRSWACASRSRISSTRRAATW